MRRVGAPVLIGFVPVDDLRTRWRTAILAGQHEGAIAVCCLPLCIAPDAANFILSWNMVFYKPYLAQTGLVSDVLPYLFS